MSHAPGFSGMPAVGHCSIAVTKAPCARSSASPTSRTNPTSPPMSRADSIRQTASTALRVALPLSPLTRFPHDSIGPPPPRGSRLALHFGAEAFFLRAQLRRELLAEVLGIEDRAEGHLDSAVERRALEPLDRLLHRLHVPDPIARDELLGLRERPVVHRALRPRESYALGFRRRREAIACQHHARLHELLVEFHHLRDELPARHLSGFGVFVSGYEHHDSHWFCSTWFRGKARDRAYALEPMGPCRGRTSGAPRTRPRSRASAF